MKTQACSSLMATTRRSSTEHFKADALIHGEIKTSVGLKKRDQWCNTKDAKLLQTGKKNVLPKLVMFIALQTYLWYQEKVNSYM